MNRQIHNSALFILLKIKSEDKAKSHMLFWTLDVVYKTDCFIGHFKVSSKSVGT